MTVRSMPRTLLLVALLGSALGSVAPAPLRAQDFLEAYEAALDAVDREDWPTAERLLETASGERPEAAQRLVRYLHFKPYVPWYYLGQARFRQGDCPGALEAWDEAERQGIAPGLEDLWTRVSEGRAECVRRARRREDARRTAAELGQLLDRADRTVEAAESLAEEGRAAGIWERGDPSPADRLRRAEEQIESARGLVVDLLETDPADTSPDAAAQEAERQIRDALDTLDALRTQVSSHREEVRARVGTERERLAAARAAASRLLESTEDLAENAPAVAEARTTLRARVDAAAEIAPDTALAELARRRERIATAAEQLREAAAPPPEALVEAADAFFAGELERAVEILERTDVEDSPDPRVRAHAALLRAAARFSLWQAGGGADLELLEAARQDVIVARGADPDLTPLSRAFSPRFLAFFEANAPETDTPEPPDDAG